MSDYNVLKNVRYQYYSGELNNDEDLEKYGFEPWSKKVLKQDRQQYIDADKSLNDLLLRKCLHDEIVEFCRSVLRELNSRTYQLRSFIDWEKFTGGPGNG